MKDKQDKLFVMINLDVVKQLQALAKQHEITPDLISKVIKHAHSCDKWRAEQE